MSSWPYRILAILLTLTSLLASVPAAAAPPTLSSVTVNPASVTGGSYATGTITLTGPAPSGGAVVGLSSDKSDIVAFQLIDKGPTRPIAAAQLQITVPANATLANFRVLTKPVAFNPNAFPPGVSVVISASHQALGPAIPPVTKRATLTVLTPLVKSLGVASPITGSQDTSGVVELNGPAPSGDAVVHLSSYNTAVATVPTTVTVAAGATSASFTVTTMPVTQRASVSVSANRSPFDAKIATLNVLQGPDLIPHIGTFNTGGCSKPCYQCPPITIGIGVKNQAGALATGYIVIKLEGPHSYTKTVNSIAGMNWVFLGRFSLPSCSHPGTTSVGQNPPNYRITVDTTNAVAESNENNNSQDFYMPPAATFTPQ